jgi:hypothetical protein
MSRTTFFSEDNLFLILGVLEDAPNVSFDPNLSSSRSGVFEIMASEYKEHVPLTEMNKSVIRTVMKQYRTSPVAAVAPSPLPPPPSPPQQHHVQRTSDYLQRDLDIHSRPEMPLLPDRPVHNAQQQRDLSAAFEQLQESRDPMHDQVVPDTIDFSDKEAGGDTRQILNRFEELQAERAAAAAAAAVAPPPSSTVAPTEEAVAHVSFDDHFQQRATAIDEHVKRRETTVQQNEVTFKHAQLYHEEEDETTQKATSSPHPSLSPTDDRMATDIQLLQSQDENQRAEFERDLMRMHKAEQLSLKIDLAQPHVNYSADTLLSTRNNRTYVHEMVFLEVGSADRNRSIARHESPAHFTVFFASQKTATHRYPIFYNHPLELSPDVRRCAGLRGCPDHAVISSESQLCDILDYEEVELKNAIGGANVDQVLKNVSQLRVNHIQLHVAISERLSQFPFILLEVADYDTMYTSTTTSVRKAFCKLFYDRSNCPGENSKHHMFIPMSNEEKLFQTPVASIDQLTFRVLTPKGNPIVDNAVHPDILLIKRIRIVADPLGQTDVYHVAIDLHNYVRRECFQENDLLSVSDIEWYNQAYFSNWLSQPEMDAKLTAQYTCENSFKEDIATAQNDSDRLKRRDAFAANQVAFHYPTCVGEANTRLHTWLCANCHKVIKMESIEGCNDLGAPIPASLDPAYANCIRIPYTYVVNLSTGTDEPDRLGHATHPAFENYVTAELNVTDTLYGLVRNDSMQTHISMGVGCRKDSIENDAPLHPSNI